MPNLEKLNDIINPMGLICEKVINKDNRLCVSISHKNSSRVKSIDLIEEDDFYIPAPNALNNLIQIFMADIIDFMGNRDKLIEYLRNLKHHTQD